MQKTKSNYAIEADALAVWRSPSLPRAAHRERSADK